MIQQMEIVLPQMKRGFHLITDIITKSFTDLPEKGLINIHVMHTSAGITINENADPTVRFDFLNFFDKLVPDNSNLYSHTAEGPDDITAHIKASLIGQTLTLPISNHRILLGTWQGIYFCEFRNYGGHRRIFITVYS